MSDSVSRSSDPRFACVRGQFGNSPFFSISFSFLRRKTKKITLETSDAMRVYLHKKLTFRSSCPQPQPLSRNSPAGKRRSLSRNPISRVGLPRSGKEKILCLDLSDHHPANHPAEHANHRNLTEPALGSRADDKEWLRGRLDLFRRFLAVDESFDVGDKGGGLEHDLGGLLVYRLGGNVAYGKHVGVSIDLHRL